MKTLKQFLTEVGMTVHSAAGNNSGFKEKAIVAQHKISKKRYTFDTEAEAERHFGKDQWNRMQSHDSWHIRAGINEGKNTPSVKQTTSASGQPAWKAMNKHGKTKFFNNEAAAHRHAGTKPLSESADKKLNPGSFSHYNHHLNVIDASTGDGPSEEAAVKSHLEMDKHYKVMGYERAPHWAELDHGEAGSQQRHKTYQRHMAGRSATAKKYYGSE